MISCEDLTFIVVAFLSFYTVQSQYCPTVYSTVNVDGQKFNVAWKTRHRSHVSAVISQPPCLDMDKNLVFRICSNGTWLTPKECHYVDFNSLCPPGFKELKGKCVYVTQPQTWNDNCPYPDASTDVKNYNNIWLPFQKKVKYGSYEYVLPDENYGLHYSETDFWENSDETLEGNSECVAKTLNKIESVSCNATFSRVCLYNHNSFLYKCPNGCVPGGLGTNYCFCKTYIKKQSSWPSCDMAILKHPYERNILYRLVGNDICLIGHSSMFGDDYLAIHDNSLYLKRADDANCVVCKTQPIAFHNVDLDLTFNAHSRKLYLTIYSPEELYKIEDDIQVFCFTDATNKLKYRVNIEEKFDSHSKSRKRRRYKVFKVSIVENGAGYYWCEAFSLPSINVIRSNQVLAYKKTKYSEYSLRMKIQNLCGFSRADCKVLTEDFISYVCKSLFNSDNFSKFIKNVRLFRIYDINSTSGTADVLLHLSVKSKQSNRDEYEMIKYSLDSLTGGNVTIVFFKSSTECLAEITNTSDTILHWDSTVINGKAVPKEVCVRDDGTPITRRCLGDFHIGSRWENITETCSKNYKVPSKTQLLSSIVLGNVSADSSISITDITANTSDLTVLDIHYLSKTLTQLSDINPASERFMIVISQIINNLMHGNSSTLRSSQIMLNATDELLDTFETTLNSVHFTNSSILLIDSDLIVHVTRPFLNNISGISLRGLSDSFLNYTVTELYSNTTFDELLNESNLEIAVFVPERLLNIISVNESASNLENLTIVTTVFYSDKFFNSAKRTEDIVGSRIVSVFISNREDYLEEPIPIIFKSTRNSKQKQCAFWNYGLRSFNRTGHWSTLGGDNLEENNTEFNTCFFSHLTNFALLIRNEYNVDDEDPHFITTVTVDKYHDDILSVISNVGCAFSILGVLGIFLTAILFKPWREKVGTKILMQLCIALFLQVILLNVATVQIAKHTSDVFCKIVGIILHYVTIAEFSWMLVAAVLQFYRFVKVVGPMPNRIILKACLIGWGFPLIPIAITCSIDIESYSIADEGICYPTGTAMYVGVFLPIVFIIIANLIVLLMILRNIFHLKVEHKGTSPIILKRQICLAILLFFLLGMPWTFGLIAELIQDSWLSYIFIYIFCFTATLQGFVLFTFYVILDKSTRLLWVEWFKKMREKRKENVLF
ncbi:hypothetical protein RI129_000394 [Pyrocoelia pectoralis]|uniref:Uncharacterized protein n=1 Tax=Pyrocoelia pectoralis TaxID=417401 RepID=A0AAN7VK41_9COLE